MHLEKMPGKRLAHMVKYSGIPVITVSELKITKGFIMEKKIKSVTIY